MLAHFPEAARVVEALILYLPQRQRPRLQRVVRGQSVAPVLEGQARREVHAGRPGPCRARTVAGAHHIRLQLSTELRHQLSREGHVTLTAADPGVSYATKAAGSWDVFQTREEVQRSFGSVFEVLSYSASETGQDTLVLRRP
jgi:hypothetical protein